MNFLGVFSLDDNKKIGLVAIGLALLFEVFGIMTFFSRKFLLLANLCFLFGVFLFVGLSGCTSFFLQRGRIKATIAYFFGFSLIIVMHLGFIGTLIQAVGLFLIFKGYLAAFYGWICRVPYVGKYLKSYKLQDQLDRLADTQSSI